MKKNNIASHSIHVCPNNECSRSFDHPIELTVLSNNPVETYLACPYCMSRIEIKEEKTKTSKHLLPTIKVKTAQHKEKEAEPVKTSELKCSHSFGYLKNRPKGSPIPDECLVCEKMIQCLA